MTRTADELTVVRSEAGLPDSVRREGGFRVLKVEGPFDFSAVGVIASLAGPIALAGISIFVISTFDTDYLLVKQETLDAVGRTLLREGHTMHTARTPS